MLTAVETTEPAWPAQLAFGTVIGLSKVDNAHEEGQFRPITLFSMLYRCWSRIRTKQMIRQMAQHMPPEALGFLPQRETAEVWLGLQAQIELFLQTEKDLTGLSTDLRRAFNNIGRPQVFLVATQLGLPQQLLRPWEKFLNQFVRRFDIHGCLGQEVHSTSGFPEGCPLSILAMLNVNWCYHVYMRAFCPQVTAYSFVDNLTLAARQAFLIAHAYMALQSICGLFGLTTDEEKTYVWGLQKHSRQQLILLGFPCLTDAIELGGAMTFGLARRTRLLKQRGQQLQPRWQKLQRSMAPGSQKLSMLPKVFWPQALHGSAICLIADQYVNDLRKAAVKHLKLNGAGSNPLLRLSLSDDMQADPGFYQLRLCLTTFRRMLTKCPDLLPMWTIWSDHYAGHLKPGPFSRLHQCLEMIGWSVQTPPWIQDHEGHQWNLQLTDHKTMDHQLEDAWLQYVATQAKHKSMHGLQGIDGFLTKLDCAHMSTLDRARLSALHSGAFMSASEKAKYDPEHLAFCTSCSCEDDRAHWLVCPRYQHVRDAIQDWQPDNVELPCCTRQHLLVPRLEFMVQWRRLLCQPEEDSNVFLVSPPREGLQHLFLDGSCSNDKYPMLNLASFSIINATMGAVVASAHLKGITQTIDRAELTALLYAFRWLHGTELEACLWSDSLSTVQVANYVQTHDCLPDGVANLDLWTELHMLLRDRAHLRSDIRWIPSHLPSHSGEDPFEDWIIHWNDRADALATHTNRQRSAAFWSKYRSVASLLDGWSLRLRQLRQFYFHLAENNTSNKSSSAMLTQTVAEDTADEDDWLWVPWTDALPLNWQVQIMHGAHTLPGQFLVSIVHWVEAAEQLEGKVRDVNDAEFVCLLLLDRAFQFPFCIDGSMKHCMRCPDQMFHRPTFGAILRPVQQALTILHGLFSHLIIRTPPTPKPQLGLYMPFRGLRIQIPDSLWCESRSKLSGFLATRAIRRACDLARPAPI